MADRPYLDATGTAGSVLLFDLKFESVTLAQATQQVIALAKSRIRCLIVTPNVDHIVSIDSDPEMKAIFQSAQYRYADGMPLVWLSRMLCKRGLPERVTGADLLPLIAQVASTTGQRLFLMGGQPGEAAAAGERLKAMYCGLTIAGTSCPPFGFENNPEVSMSIVQEINSADVDILFIGVGTPKQEKWAWQYLGQLRVGPVLGVGAAFAFTAGTMKRAPQWLQHAGLEWAWRLALNPARLWRRYLVKDSKFLKLALREFRTRRAQR